MVDVPEFGFDAMTHQQLVDLVREAPPGDVNAPVAERLTKIATQLDEGIERIQAALGGGTWTGAAAQAAGELVDRMREFSAHAREQATFFSAQAGQQSEGAQRVRTAMPAALGNPLAQAPDFTSTGLVSLTESMFLKETAAAEARTQAHEIMSQWAAESVTRVDQLSTMDPLSTAPGPTSPQSASSTAQPVAAPGGPSAVVQAQGIGLLGVAPMGAPTGAVDRAPRTGEPVRANPGVPRLATESVRGGRPAKDEEHRKRYSVESDEYFDVDEPPVIGEQ